jgi:hypothetical protein
MRSALPDLLPPGLIAEAIRDVFPREAMGEAFREGLALFFSPFTRFWQAVRAAMSRQPAR